MKQSSSVRLGATLAVVTCHLNQSNKVVMWCSCTSGSLMEGETGTVREQGGSEQLVSIFWSYIP